MKKYIGQHIFDYVASFRQKVGIGIDSPTSLLHIKEDSSNTNNNAGLTIENDGTGDAVVQYLLTGDRRWVTGIDNSDNNSFKIASTTDLGTNTALTIKHTGEIGIGTNSPASLLHIKQDDSTTGTDAGLTIENDGTGDAVAQFLLTGSRRFVIGIDNSDSNKLKIARSSDLASDAIMTLDGSSNVGIGTSTPSNKLDIVGDVKVHSTGSGNNATLFIDTVSGGNADSILNFREGTVDRASLYWDGGDNDLYLTTTTGDFLINPSGNVGIGETNPSEKLHVSGNAIITGGDSVAPQIKLLHDGTNPSTNEELGVVQFQVDYNGSHEDWGKIRLDTNASAFRTNMEFYVKSASGSEQVALTLQGQASAVPNAAFAGDVTVSGNLTVSGTTTTIDTTNLNVEDKNITLNYSTGDSSSAADGAGITIQDAVDSSTDATILWNATTDRFTFSHDINLPDSVGIRFGTDGDSLINHSGSNMSIINNTGDITFTNNADNKDIIFQSDDGSGGVAQYFRLDGGLGYTVVEKDIRFEDNVKATFGSSNDMKLYHNGTHSVIENHTGDLFIINNTDDGDIKFQSDDGSGGVATYMTIDGSTTNVGIGTTSPGYKLHVSGGGLQTTTATDNRIAYYDGSGINAYGGSNGYSISNYGGDLKFIQTVDDKDIIFQSDDGSGGVTEYFRLDGGEVRTISSKNIRFVDNATAEFGNSNDLKIYHDASNSYIQNTTGDLYIRQDVDDKDIIFQCDDQSGGLTTYLTIDGSNGYIRLEDDRRLTIGSGNDLQLRHNSNNSYITNFTGPFNIVQQAADQDITFQCDDGSGDVETYFQLDGSSATHDGSSYTSLYTQWPDNSIIALGTGKDFNMYHTGSKTLLNNTTGNLEIRNSADDSDIIFQSDDGSGGTTTYFKLSGANTNIELSKNLYAKDDVKIAAGDGLDLRMYHESSSNDSFIRNATGDLYVRNVADDKDIIFQSDDGSGGVTDYIRIDGSADNTKIYKDLRYQDNVKAKFGAVGDLEIYHDGSNNYIQGVNGDLYIQNGSNDKDIILRSDDGSGGQTAYITLDGSETRTVIAKAMRFNDNTSLQIGGGADFSIHHDGGNTLVQNITGHLYFYQKADDSDITFFCDDGSGGNAEYFRIDGGQEVNVFSKNIKLEDNVMGMFGGGNDLKLRHNGTDSFIENETGDLTIKNNADDKDIIFQSDDGSGGVETYFFLDGDSGRTRFNDGKYLVFGTDQNLFIVHDGSNSYIQNYTTGDLRIDQQVDDKDIVVRWDDGSGGLTTYLTLDGSETNIKVEKNLYATDGVLLSVGNGLDLRLKHDGTDSFIFNETGHLYIQNKADDKDIIFQTDDGSGGVTEYFKLVGSTNGIVQSVDSYVLDNKRILFGNGGDMKLYHDGTDSYIHNDTGNLYIENDTDDGDIFIRGDNGSGGLTEYIRIDGGVKRTLFKEEGRFTDNVNLKFGTGGDTMIYHDGSNSYIDHTGTGDLLIRQGNDDGNIIFQADDNSGGLTEYFRLNGTDKRVKVQDGVRFVVGTGSDLQIYHNGANSFIENTNGDFTISNKVDDKDIIFQCDDGSGDVTEYFRLDGGDEKIVVSKPLNLLDSTGLKIGTGGNDFSAYHNGTDTYLDNNTGNLNIRNTSDDKDIKFVCDDGSGGVETYLTIDGSARTVNFGRHAFFPDGFEARFGTSNDLEIYHDGSNSYISQEGTGNLLIMQKTNDKDIVFYSDNGAGGTAEYFKLDGSLASHNGSSYTALYTAFPDNSIAAFGDSQDLVMYHSGSNSFVRHLGTGHLYFDNTTDDANIYFRSDDGSGGLATYFKLNGSSVETVVQKTMRWEDSVEARFGDGSDLKIYHDGSNSYIKDSGTGNLRIDASNLHFRNADGSKLYASGIDGGAFTLRHNNVTKLATSADGVDITGDLNVSVASTSSGIYAQFINLKGFCTLAANYKFAEDLEDTLAPFEMALDYGSATISSSTEVNQSQLFRASGFHVPVACSVNAINMQLTCNNTGNVTIAVVEYRPSEAGTDQVDHPRTVYEEVVVASNDNNNKVKTVTVATADLDNTAVPAGSHIMIMAKGDSDSIGGKAFISAAIEIKW